MKVATTRYPTSRHNAMRPQSLIMLSFEHVAVVVVVSQKTGNSPKIKDQTRNGHHTCSRLCLHTSDCHGSTEYRTFRSHAQRDGTS